jgi:hypothetical protein
MLVGTGRRRLDDSDQTILFDSFCRREVMGSDVELADIASSCNVRAISRSRAKHLSKRNGSGSTDEEGAMVDVVMVRVNYSPLPRDRDVR